jgi:hypothetical protein
LLSLPPATKMFQFAGLARSYLFDSVGRSFGLPHSDIFGSMLASSSPKRFVGRYVLLRLCVPRYPPLALSSLTCYHFWTLSFAPGFLYSFLTFLSFRFYAVFKVLFLRSITPQHSHLTSGFGADAELSLS